MTGMTRRAALTSTLALAVATLSAPAAAQTAAAGTTATPPGEATAPDRPGTAAANSAETGAGGGGVDTQEIVVTGSRLARSTFDTPSPVTVLGGDDLQRLQIVNIGAGIAQLPAFRPSNNPTTNGFGSFNVGAQIVNLRGLGVTRNLVLVDGRRFAPSTREGSVDLNFIPSVLVARTEVVTGGASAAYGSDALAGVVNIILDKRLQGFRAQVDQGISEAGDARNPHISAAWGTDIGDRGHFVIGGEWSDQKGTGNCFERSWCRPGAVVVNPGYAANNGLPQYVRNDSNAGFFFSPAGVVSRVNNAAGVGLALANRFGTGAITFAPNGTVLPSIAGSPASGLSQVGGSLYATYTNSNLVVPVERYTGFAHGEWEFSDALSGFVEGSYGHVDGGTFQTAYFSSTLPIFADNPFIPLALRSALPAASQGQPTAPASLVRPTAASFNLGKVFDDLARGFSQSKADTYRATAGLSGRFGGGYSWDAYYQYGRTDRLQTVDNNLVVGDPAFAVGNPATIARSNARFFFAADAVVDPATGRPTCRALLSPDAALRTAAAGCVPLNLFGAGNVTDAGRNYVYAQLREDITLQQHVAAANLRGETADLLAGPLSFAIGGEYRVDRIDVGHDDLSNLYAYFQNFGSDYDGKTEVAEAYLEAELPILRDVPGFHALTVNGAIRQARYKISGFGSYLRTDTRNTFDATTWKVSVNWEPTEWLRLRGTQSRDVRAPNFAELFLASASSFTPVVNPFVRTPAGAPTTNFPSIFNGGAPNVGPEKADTTTVGIVFDGKPGFLPGLRLSVDGYRIRIRDYIGQAPGGAQFLVDRCFAGITQACAFVDRDAAGSLTAVRNVSLNLDEIMAKGVDFEADYRLRLGGENQLLLRGVATYVDTLRTTSLGDVVDRAGQTGNTVGLAAPDWTLNGTATFVAPRWSLTVQGRYIASGLYDSQRIGPDDSRYATTLLNSISNNNIPGRFYANLFGSVFVGEDKRFELFGSINNLFDRDPPAAPETQFYTNPIYFDTIGRYYRVGARVKL